MSVYMALQEFHPKEKVICDFTAYKKYQRIDHNGSELQRVFGIQEDCLPSVLEPIVHSRRIMPRAIRKILVFAGYLKYHDAMNNNYNYDATVFQNNGFVIYHQCWTSWRYFEKIENRVREVFSFAPLKDLRNINSQALMQSVESVCIHVRRGDYLNSSVHGGLVDINYYIEAIAIMRERLRNPHFFVFSDDAEWASENICKAISAPVMLIDWNNGSDSYIDMQLMASCRHHIIPNSSFSWWGAYLSNGKDKQVIAPKYWSNYSTGVQLKDMNMPGWTELDNLVF